jgi:hypothetical protein
MFEGRDIYVNIELHISALKENTSEPEREISVCKQASQGVTQKLWKLSAICSVFYSQMHVITGELPVRVYSPMKISIFNRENIKAKVQITIK